MVSFVVFVIVIVFNVGSVVIIGRFCSAQGELGWGAPPFQNIVFNDLSLPVGTGTGALSRQRSPSSQSRMPPRGLPRRERAHLLERKRRFAQDSPPGTDIISSLK